MNDTQLTVNGDDLRIPEGLNMLAGAAVLATTPVAFLGARLVSPTLRRVCNHYIEPISEADEFAGLPECALFYDTPIELTPDESLNLQINSNPAAASAHFGAVWLSDGPMAPVGGDIRTIRATAAITLAAGTWVNGPITFDEVLAAGNYEIVGLRVRSANGIAARLSFVGGAWRPGVLCVDADNDTSDFRFRFGRMGSFGSFHTTTPPSIDVLGDTDASQVIHLDIIKV